MARFNSIQFFYGVAKKLYKPFSFRSLVGRIKFLLAARQHSEIVNNFNTRLDSLGVHVTPEMLGTIIWPYINNRWHAATKLDVIAMHYEILALDYPALTHVRDIKHLEVSNFSDISTDVTIKIDYAQWFTREGELSVNVFQADLRVASLAFSLGYKNEEVVVYIGAVQGIHGGIPAKQSLGIYKNLTKDFSGLRPRTMLLEVLKVVTHKLGAKKIFAVSEQNRHHRHKYFGNDQSTKFTSDYNAFWEEHRGILNKRIGFYEIPMQAAIRDISEIPTKKRALYRRRNEFIKSINSRVTLN